MRMVKGSTKTIYNFRGTSSKKGLITIGLVVKLEKLKAGHSLELHMTLCVNFRHIIANFILKWTKISHIL